MIVFDEADQMLAQGMRDDSLRIKKYAAELDGYRCPAYPRGFVLLLLCLFIGA